MSVPTAVTGVRIMDVNGIFGAPQRVSWQDGTFSLEGTVGGDGEVGNAGVDNGLWMLPGLVDAHAHVAWHAFSAEDRDRETPEERDLATIEVLGKMLRAGFTSVRDAGGFEPGAADSSTAVSHLLPRVQASVEIIGRESADAAGGVLAATERALARGARWVKLVGTASVASPAGAGLEPHFTADEQRAVVARAAEVGAGVMLHAWGGSAIDDAIDAGVMSIEHGIFLTPEQAVRAADAGMTHVPTLLIYRHVQRMIAEGKLPAAFAKRVDEAVARHPGSVRIARDAGLPIALGTDFSTPEQHGTNRQEFDALVAAGLTTAEALVAATRSGAELLARVEPGTGLAQQQAPRPAPRGRIAHGEIADAVIMSRDPHSDISAQGSAFSAPDSVVAVIIGGRYIEIDHTDHTDLTLRKETP